MAALRARHLLLLLLVLFVRSERIRKIKSDSTFVDPLREASNQTNAEHNTDTLNLPANASSIRENITDTFSCENRTYGYYADVDNDCQVFHVCLPSQAPGGRNVTYRWSFICPKETVFNQVVLTCTRVADSIDCADSPDYYHLNMELGKEYNKTEEGKDKKDNRKVQKKKHEKKNENFVMEKMPTEFLNEALKGVLTPTELTKGGENGPLLIETVIESVGSEIEDIDLEQDREEMDRLVMERSMRNNRQMKRGTFRFRGDF